MTVKRELTDSREKAEKELEAGPRNDLINVYNIISYHIIHDQNSKSLTFYTNISWDWIVV